jgi:hypothetical protein
MAIFPLYRDFFRFLEAIETGQDPWPVYQDLYVRPHGDFFKAYWTTFFPHIDVGTLQDRIRRIRRGHYAILEDLIMENELDRKVAVTIGLCRKLLPEIPPPDVYLLVGFFSADGFIVWLGERPVIGIGLERYRDVRLLDIILAHEYCHYARHLALGTERLSPSDRLDRKLFSEGLSIHFSRQVFPRRPLCDHLLMSRRRLNWCQKNEEKLLALTRDRLHSDQLIPVLFGTGSVVDGIPPRAGMYLGYRLVEIVLGERGGPSFEKLLALSDVTAVWPSKRLV